MVEDWEWISYFISFYIRSNYLFLLVSKSIQDNGLGPNVKFESTVRYMYSNIAGSILFKGLGESHSAIGGGGDLLHLISYYIYTCPSEWVRQTTM